MLAARPTLLLALALEAATPTEKAELLALIKDENGRPTLDSVRRLYAKLKVFDKAEKMIEKFRAKAEALADDVTPTELRELLYYLIDTVLTREAPAAAPDLGVSLPLVSAN